MVSSVLKSIRFLFLVAFVCGVVASQASAAPKLTVKGKIAAGSGYSVLLVSEDGSVRSVAANAQGRFSIPRITKAKLRQATIHLSDENGRYVGPVVLKSKGNKAYLGFSGNAAEESTIIDLGTIALREEGFAKTRRAPIAAVRSKRVTRAANGVPVGAGRQGLVEVSTTSTRVVAQDEETPEGADSDRDGILDLFDADDDGDLTPDYADPESAESTAQDSPYTALFLELTETLNVNASAVTQEDIDAVVGGENVFSLAFFQSAPPDSPLGITGGHVVCNDNLVYCRSAAAGGSTGIYSGLSESSGPQLGQPWSDFNADGSGFPNLEYLSSRGALAAGIQPRVGTDQFRPGDLYLLRYTNEDGDVVRTTTLTLPPYFITVPAMKSYVAGSGVQNVSYPVANGAPGTNMGSPIVLDTDGELTITFWPPQRTAVAESEGADYIDMGHLHYGLLIGGLDQEATCAGFYSGLSGLTENPDALGEGGSPFSQNGAILWPLDDSASDSVPSATNTRTFTINLKDCLARAGGSPGTYVLTLTAAGESFRGGANRSAQNIYVTIP